MFSPNLGRSDMVQDGRSQAVTDIPTSPEPSTPEAPIEYKNHTQFLAQAFAITRKRDPRDLNCITRTPPSTVKREKSGHSTSSPTGTAGGEHAFEETRNLNAPRAPKAQLNRQPFSADSGYRRFPDKKDGPLGSSDGSHLSFAASVNMPSQVLAENNQCICPISFQCEKKGDGRTDCRLLILERTAREKKQEANDPDVYPEALPVDVDETDEVFASRRELKQIFKYCNQIDAPDRRPRLQTLFRSISEWNQFMLQRSVTEENLKDSNVLARIEQFISPEHGDVRLQRKVPQFLVEDLTFLLVKWASGDYSARATRGLRPTERGFTLDEDYEHNRPHDYFGHGLLVNGQTWLRRAEMVRDGAHGEYEAGICGTVSAGAYSIVVGLHDERKSKYYADVDIGFLLWYVGTALKREKDDTAPTNVPDGEHYPRNLVIPNDAGQGPTASTKKLLTSFHTGKPVRVFRSFRAAPIISHRPRKGYRYDGLYVVRAFQLRKKMRQIYIFEMERMQTGQGPLRANFAELSRAAARH